MSEDELKKYHHFKIKTSDKIELDLIETKYYEDLLDLYKQEKEKNKILEDGDMTQMYVNGYYDGEDKWKDKIKAILEEYRYTKTEDTEKIIEFYTKIQGLLEEN